MSGTTGIELRPEVRAFAEAMQRLLDEHDEEKGDSWKECEETPLLLSLYQQVAKLDKATYSPQQGLPGILRAAASVGAHAMFVADVCGALPTERGER